MTKDDPYHDRKLYHFADRINDRGGVSALCFKLPRAINLRIALWTLREDAVTCLQCRKLLRQRKAAEPAGSLTPAPPALDKPHPGG